MRFVDIIEKKRDGLELETQEIQAFIKGYVDETIPDYQVSALLMAIVLKGMSARETADLTMAMLHSGDQYHLDSIQGIKVDKHSTGGVGDKTSLALGPMVAACGAKIAKMSGRGLGHTGGTLDKLESIHGFQIGLGETEFIQQVNEIGISIIGQTDNTVPADKKLYALRDVTGTVPAIPLIASSIMSKKLASGADTILLDVKFGDGAFMQTAEKAEELAQAMIDIGKSLNRDVRAMISDMNQPLGYAIGNALEVKEAVETLMGKGPEDFTELCLEAGSIMLQQAKIVHSKDEALSMLKGVIADGSALNKLIEMVRYQHGDVEQIKDVTKLDQAKTITPIYTKKAGYVKEMKAMHLGTLAMKLGAGRETKDDVINPAVGLVLACKVGTKLNENQMLLEVHHDTPLTNDWLEELYNCFVIVDEVVSSKSLIHKIV